MPKNRFIELEEVVDEKTTNNVTRKAKKKLREIETLKYKSAALLTEEEIGKIQLEEYWRSFFPKRKLRPLNKFGVTHCLEPAETDASAEECPICLSNIPRGHCIQTNCRHNYCEGCLSGVIRSSVCSIRCAMCRSNINRLVFQNEYDMLDVMNALAFKH